LSSQKTTSYSDKKIAVLGACGVLSPLFLIVATVAGDALRDDYDFISQSISELYEVGAPNAPSLMVFFTAYHALVIPLAIGLHRGLPHTRFSWVGPLLLGSAGFLGIPLGAYARCDPGCFGATTFRGQLHGVLVLITVILVLAAMLMTWLRARTHPQWQGYAQYTLWTLIIGITFGLGMTPFIQGQFAGLLERISVTIIVQWYAMTGLFLIAKSRMHRLIDSYNATT
jgi:hypothetical protein